MRSVLMAALGALAIAGCSKGEAGGKPSGDVTCADVVAHVATLDAKIDADGKKLFEAICNDEPQDVRKCMLGAKSMKDLDTCDPHPLGKKK